MNKIEEIENKIIELTKELEELKKEKSNLYEPKWFPKVDEEYWFINCEGKIDSSIWENDSIDIYRRAYLKIFKTEEDAEEYYDYIQAKKKYSYEFTLSDWEDFGIDKYFIYYSFQRKQLEIDTTWNCQECGVTYFKSKEDAKEFMNKYKKQFLKYDIGIKEV